MGSYPHSARKGQWALQARETCQLLLYFRGQDNQFFQIVIYIGDEIWKSSWNGSSWSCITFVRALRVKRTGPCLELGHAVLNSPLRLVFLIDDIAVGVVLDREAAWVVPVIKDLTAKNVPPNAPHLRIALRTEMVMPKLLDVQVMYLKRCVVWAGVLLPGKEREVKEGMMIAVVPPQVDVVKDGHILRRCQSYQFALRCPNSKLGVCAPNLQGLC